MSHFDLSIPSSRDPSPKFGRGVFRFVLKTGRGEGTTGDECLTTGNQTDSLPYAKEA